MERAFLGVRAMSRRRKFDWSIEHDSANCLALTLKIGNDAIPLATQDDLADAQALRVQASILIGDLIDAAIRADRRARKIAGKP